jgi:ABC-type transport system involved in cytochrome c biogenesis permease subunit
MGIPLSLFLVAGGAILAFAVTDNANGIDLYAVGWILMAAGVVLLVLSLIMWDSWAGGGFWNRGPGPRRRQPPY